ncbi:MAG: bifunctional folylpolyglutamate synthase/dihydrofolate synthase [Syntrophales bacterium]|nr:bifunctional folylpolyglutamate synthase/dihydrofolate synthase [Syntrophales bacterium]
MVDFGHGSSSDRAHGFFVLREMDYRGALAYLDRLERKGIHLGLSELMQVLARLGNPQEGFPSVLIGGTNGKGSIASLMTSVLRQEGYQVGLYTSPHLEDIRERIKINGEDISQDDFTACVELVCDADSERSLSYFEFLTACAFVHFFHEKVDIAVVEVGMGGRFDATNVLNPLVSVISNVFSEHREFLGRTIAQIAREKAGIIKQGGVCVTSTNQRQVVEIFERICREKDSSFFRVGRDFKYRCFKDGSFHYWGLHRSFKNLYCSLTGDHQVRNAVTALGALEILAEREGFVLSERGIREGLIGTFWPGRLESFQTDLSFILDGAHNPAGIRALCRYLKKAYPEKNIVMVFGVLSDKDYKAMLRSIRTVTKSIVLTKPEVERARDPEEMVSTARLLFPMVQLTRTPEEALNVVREVAAPEDIVVVTGSLYLVGKMRGILRET